jgi:membrane associated rhomboid family serine protease
MNRVFFRFGRVSLAVPFLQFLNFGVFVWWILLGDDSPVMNQNFLVSYQGLEEGRFWTLLTSAFSHNMFLHFFLNMYVFGSFGRVVESQIGFRSFVRFYVFAGVISSLSHALVCKYLLGQPELPALGASGSVAGIVLLFSLMFPKERILILGLIPIPAILGALLVIGIDLWGLSAQVGGHGLPIGHGAHLGGALAGILFYYFKIRPNRNNKNNNNNHSTSYSSPRDPNVIDVEYEKKY